MRFRNKNGTIYWILSWQTVVQKFWFKKDKITTYIYCRDEDMLPFRFTSDDILRYE